MQGLILIAEVGGEMLFLTKINEGLFRRDVLFHPSEVKKYTRGPNDDEKLWEHAVKNNPDPTCLVPALAVGFGDLKKRAQEQDKYLRNMRYRLGEISIALDLLSQRHETDNRTRIQEIKRSHQAISGRVLSLMKKIHCMRNKGLVLNLGEDRLKGRLEALEFQLKKPGQYKTRLATLWRELSVLGTAMVDPASEKVIAADAEKLHKVLSDQYQGISHVIDVIKEDQHDLDVMEKLLKRESDAMFDSVSLT
ncbi:hypothetical protein HMI56_000289 [Coelomomyces lativittatus]|nr:hypothetical protein HMI56_000289 [Coelomomyces lativittatus]